jgi:hypothetical protein
MLGRLVWNDTASVIGRALNPGANSFVFKYNNQDHAIATGTLAARRALGIGWTDPWTVNIDAEYHESTRDPAAA